MAEFIRHNADFAKYLRQLGVKQLTDQPIAAPLQATVQVADLSDLGPSPEVGEGIFNQFILPVANRISGIQIMAGDTGSSLTYIQNLGPDTLQLFWTTPEGRTDWDVTTTLPNYLVGGELSFISNSFAKGALPEGQPAPLEAQLPKARLRRFEFGPGPVGALPVVPGNDLHNAALPLFIPEGVALCIATTGVNQSAILAGVVKDRG